MLWIIIHTDSPQLIPTANAEFSVQWGKYRILVLERKLEILRKYFVCYFHFIIRNPKFKLFIAYSRSYDTASLVNIPNIINILLLLSCFSRVQLCATPETNILTSQILLTFRSDQISHSVVSDSLRPHESQHARPPCPSSTPRVHSDSRPLCQ